MLTDAQWKLYDEQGYLFLGKVADAVHLQKLQDRIDDIMLGKVRYPSMYFQLDSATGEYKDVLGGGEWSGATLDYRKIQLLEMDPYFLEYIQNPLFRDITSKVYGENVAIYRAMFMNKPAHKGTVLPYHQDGGGIWGLDRNPLMTVWTALNDATRENGCMQVVPGSHKLGLLSEYGHVISQEHEQHYAPEEKSVYLEAKCGEAILLHNWLLHRSGVNHTSEPRRAFTVCYMDGETRSVREGHQFPRVFGEGALSAGATAG